MAGHKPTIEISRVFLPEDDMAHCFLINCNIGNLLVQQEELGRVYFYILRCERFVFVPFFFRFFICCILYISFYLGVSVKIDTTTRQDMYLNLVLKVRLEKNKLEKQSTEQRWMLFVLV